MCYIHEHVFDRYNSWFLVMATFFKGIGVPGEMVLMYSVLEKRGGYNK